MTRQHDDHSGSMSRLREKKGIEEFRIVDLGADIENDGFVDFVFSKFEVIQFERLLD
jgi:hypothetical protein